MQQRSNGNKQILLSPEQQKEAGNFNEAFFERYFRETKDHRPYCDFFCTREIFASLEANYRYLFNCKEKETSTDFISINYEDSKPSCKETAAKWTAGVCLAPFALVGTTLTLFTDGVRSLGRACLGRNEPEELSKASSSSADSAYGQHL